MENGDCCLLGGEVAEGGVSFLGLGTSGVEQVGAWFWAGCPLGGAVPGCTYDQAQALPPGGDGVAKSRFVAWVGAAEFGELGGEFSGEARV